MKISTFVLFLMALLVGQSSHAQTVDEILSNYFENIGGEANWKKLSGVKMTAKVNQGGMEIPVEMVQLNGGKQYQKITFQGQVIMQGVFDGETLWNTNFQSMKAEMADAETLENTKLDANDFPEPFVGYKDKGYTVELMGTESFEGTETFKIKLMKEQKTVDGQKVDDVSYYYFESESFVPICVETEVKDGPAKGQFMQVKMSDYQEVEGLYFPFTITQGVKGGMSAPISVEKIELNPTIDNSIFAFPN
jgi:hypothetical protein